MSSDFALDVSALAVREGDAQGTRWSWTGQDVEATYPNLRTFWRHWLSPDAGH